jgi:hypothetical protein
MHTVDLRPPLTPAQQFEQASSLAELLRLAIVDFGAALLDPRYVIDFNGWHRPIVGSLAVCAAGAVMAKRFGAGDRRAIPDDFPAARDRLEAVYWLSIGRIKDAAAVVTISRGVIAAATIDAVPLEALSPKVAAAMPLAERWEPILGFANCARLDRAESRRLLAHLTDLQVDLAEAGL